jgi:hypothetical protein
MPTVSYVPRSEVDDELTDELERRDRVICVVGPSKSGKTVAVKKLLPNSTLIVGQVGVKGGEIWRHLCAIGNVPLRHTEGLAGTLTARGGPISAEQTREQYKEIDLDARRAFIDFVKRSGSIVFDDFHYFELEAQQEILQGLRQLLHDRIAIVIILTWYGEDQPALAERDMLARMRFIRIPNWSKEELRKILEKGFSALNVKLSSDDTDEIVSRSFGNPLITQELGSFLCNTNEVKARPTNPRRIELGNPEVFVRSAVFRGGVAGDRATFMQLIVGRTPPRERKEYRLRSGDAGDVYFLIFSALRELDVSSGIAYEALRNWIKNNVESAGPQGGQITSALDGLGKTSRELVQSAQKANRSRELPIDWRSDIRTIYVNDPFLKLYIKWSDWNQEYREIRKGW